jgi:uncharacterized protein
MVREQDIAQIVSHILPLDPYRVVLFGSYAGGVPTPDSDIDLLVVMDSPDISQSYAERMARRLAVRRSIRDINARVPIDLLVYTRAEYELLMNDGAGPVATMGSRGKTLYEKAG